MPGTELTILTMTETESKSTPTEPTEITEDTNEEIDSREEWEQQRDMHKAAADKAYSSGDVKTAIEEYTKAIEFDPEWHILYSNRSPAYLKNGEKSKALADAKKCVELKPDFVKGHSRLANALYSLGRYNEARNVFRHILSEMDPDHLVSKEGIDNCTEQEQRMKQKEVEMLRHAQEQAKKAGEEDNYVGSATQQNHEDGKKDVKQENDDNDDDDDLLNDFFDEVDEVKDKKKDVIKQNEKETKNEQSEERQENKIQIQLTDLGDANTQIQRLLCPNHEWYNLNPFRVLDISHKAPIDLLSRRYKALSLLLHPDKVRAANYDKDIVEKAEQAFEYVRKANVTLKDEDKNRHISDLVEQGRKQGKRDFELAQRQNPHAEHDLGKFQDIATMKIFAEIERKRRDVERRKRKFEERERGQEDAENDKVKKEHDFEMNWKQEGRVEKRINNWRDFKSDKKR